MELNAQKRTELGKKSKKLKRDRKLPGVVFAKGMESLPVTLELLQFQKVYKDAGESSLVDVTVGDDKFKVLISEVARHPVTNAFVHVNLHKVNLKEKITATIPLKFVGESPAVKDGIGLLLTLIDEIDVETLPTDLPKEIVVDISGLAEVDQSISVKDLPIDRTKVEIVGHEEDELVAKIDYAEMKEEAAPEPVSEEELIAKVEATEQLSEEEKAKKAAEAKKEKEKEDK